MDNKYRIEKRLKLSGVTGLERLSRKPIDKRSVGSESGRLDDDSSLQDEDDYNKQNHQHVPRPQPRVLGDEEEVFDPDVESLYSDVTESTQFSMFNFSHDTDNDIVPSILEDAYSAHTGMPLEREIQYIRQCFEKVELKVMQWASNAEKERALAEMVPCALECGIYCKVEDMTSHVRDHCPLRTTQCPVCHLVVLFQDVHTHATRLCGKRTIGCPNAYQGCAVLVTPDSLQAHLRSHCELRMVPCRQFCSMLVPWRDRDKHEAEFCKNRMLECDQCHQQMTANTYTAHLHDTCGERMVVCRIGCGQSFKARNLDAHEENDCLGYCRWECGTRMGPPAKLRLHETVDCLERPVECCLSCNVPRLTRRTQKLHETQQCLERTVACQLGCGADLTLKQLRKHMHMFTGDCPRRLVYCPSNLVGWRIQLLDGLDTTALVLRYERRKLNPIDVPSSSSSLRVQIHFGDFLYVRSPKGQTWINIWGTDFILLEKSMGEDTNKLLHRDEHFTCGTFPFSSLTSHLYLSCPQRKVSVTGEVDRRTGQLGQTVSLSEAMANTALRLAYDDFEEREQVNADGSQGILNVACSYCAKTVLRSELDTHCLKDCSEYHVFCPYGCGKYLPNRDIEAHCKDTCVKRTVTCLLCMNSDLWAEELSHHQSVKCPKRLVSCGHECGIENLCACDLEMHMNDICILRKVQCSCGLSFQAKDLDDHVRLNCINRIVQCPQGCGESMPQSGVDNHIEFFCRNKTHYYNKTVECPQACGAILMRRDLLHHVSFDCSKRLVECSQNCGNTVQLDLLAAHLRICPQRLLCCEPGMHMCARPFHQWFFKQIVKDEGPPVYHNIALDHLKRQKQERDGGDQERKNMPMTTDQTSLDNEDLTYINSMQHLDDDEGEDDTLFRPRNDDDTFSGESFQRQHKVDVKHARDKLKSILQAQKQANNLVNETNEKDATEKTKEDGAIDEEGDPEDESSFVDAFAGKKEGVYKGRAVNIQLQMGPSGGSKDALTMHPANHDGQKEVVAKKSLFDMLVVTKNKKNQHGHDNQTVATDNSSIFFEGHAMKFRELLQMHFCARHRVSALMAAVRYQELDLLEYIARQVKESADIDVENVHGDTALTLACRMGRLDFVEVLVHHGADINLETSNGRTALIEAVKCDTENVPLIEFLIREGALIKYKTSRHGKTSLDWARRFAYSEAQMMKEKAAVAGETIEITKERMRVLGRPKTVRLLELAATVQQQANMLFTKIAVGDYKWVLRVISEGDFFDANNEIKAYKEMDVYVDKALAADKALADVQSKNFGLSHRIDQLYYQREEVLRSIQKAERDVAAAYEKERDLDGTISLEFAAYEKIAAKLQLIDVEEILRLQVPSPLLLVSLFAVGHLFDLYPSSLLALLQKAMMHSGSRPQLTSSTAQGIVIEDGEDRNAVSLSLEGIEKTKSLWYPVIRAFLTGNTKEALRRLQTYSRAKLHLDRSQELFHRVLDIVNVFRLLAYSMSAQHAAKMGTQFSPSSTTKQKRHYEHRSHRKKGHHTTSGSNSPNHHRQHHPRQRTTSAESQNSADSGMSSFLPFHGAGEAEMDIEAARMMAVANVGATPFSGTLSPPPSSPNLRGVSRAWSQGSLASLPEDGSHSNYQPFHSSLWDNTEALGVPYVDTLAFSDRPHTSGQTQRPDSEQQQKEAAVDDAEWDSDAEGAAGGSWVKGEWVPVVKKKARWWEKKDHQLTPEELAQAEAERQAKEAAEAARKWEAAKVLRITDASLEAATRETIADLKNRNVLRVDYETSLLQALAQKQAEAEALAEAAEEEKRARSQGGRRRSSTTSKRRTSSVSPTKLKNTREGYGDMGEIDGENSGFSPPQTAGGSLVDGSMSTGSMTMMETSPSRRQSASSSHRKGSRRSRRGSSQSNSPSSRSPTRRRSNMVGDDVLDFEVLQFVREEDLAGYALVASVERLIKAITRYALNYKDVLIYKQGTLQAVRTLESLREESARLLAQYDEEYAVRGRIEATYIAAMKTSKFLHDKVNVFREKVRVARLMNTVSANGHTPISWAAAYGAYEVVEEMLSRGGTVGYVAPLLHLTGTYLQLSYRIFRTSYDARMRNAKIAKEKAEAGYEVAALVSGTSSSSKADQLALVRTLTMLKDQRQKLLDQITYLRGKMRFPVPEAVYCGHWEIVQRIYERRLLHSFFMNTWSYPSPPPTYRRRLENQYEHSRMSIVEVMAHGMNDIAAGMYDPNQGWVGANDPSEPFGETYLEIHRILQSMREKRQAFLAGRRRIRILARERLNQKNGEIAMMAAIRRHDFVTCIKLAQDRGITIDLETQPDGLTALVAAAEEDPDAMNHTYLINLDGRKCLAVEYLLDRVYYRPAVNLETTQGTTALIRACILGRSYVVSALLDRGADINHVNCHGNTALHYAAVCGHNQVTRILVERLADVTIKDRAGFTAYDIAERENFVDLMSILSQFRSGNLGDLQLTRGYVNNKKTCPLGCGEVLFPYQVSEHLTVCQLRIIACPNECDVHVMARDMGEHLQVECPLRIIYCPDCKVDGIVARELPVHLHDTCVQRIVRCPLKCEKEMAACDVELHLMRHCPHRIVPCPNLCDQTEITAAQMEEHLADHCTHRRVSCPRKCHTTVVYHRLAEHLAEVCSMRMVRCAHCASEITYESRERHETKECEARPVPCPWKCGVCVGIGALTKHQNEECSRQPLLCPLAGCGRKIYRGSMQKHVEMECAQRLVVCPNGCVEVHQEVPSGNELVCIEIGGSIDVARSQNLSSTGYREKIREIPAKLLPYHLKYDCPHRHTRCSLCLDESVLHKDLMTHQAEVCMKRMVHCRNPGCQKTLPFDEREAHEVHQCRFRMAPCQQACGEQVLALQMTNHCQRQCLMRFVECPLQCQLVQPLRAKDLEVHLQFECPRRHSLATQTTGSGKGGMSASLGYSRPLSQPQKSKKQGEKKLLLSSSLSTLPTSSDDK